MMQQTSLAMDDTIALDQFRMSQMQLFNWGTFSNLHTIPIAKKGYLIVGSSGAGKSTLLDALSALLVPPQWLAFNAAAREGDRIKQDRNIALYVRGAWGSQTDDVSGEITTQFLRKGTTWSALSLQFINERGRIITLLAVFVLRGTSSRMQDVKRHYFILQREFDIGKELADFDLDIRKLKAKLDNVYYAENFKAYAERFRMQLNIQSEMALKLLHKTQSAKNLGDLNIFLREYMLDEPDTFKIADRMIDEFTELDVAHQTVVTLRDQVNLLKPAISKFQAYLEIDKKVGYLNSLYQFIDDYMLGIKAKLWRKALTELISQQTSQTAEINALQEMIFHDQTQLFRLEAEHREHGGDRIELIQMDIEREDKFKEQKQTKLGRIKSACQILQSDVPSDPNQFSELLLKASQLLESWQQHSQEEQAKRDQLRDKKHQTETEFTEVIREVSMLKRQPSNIPAHMLELRSHLTVALNLPESSLPFVGELLEVKESEKIWQGAIERVLHGFALSILVEDKHYKVLADYVNETNLKGRLVYYRVPNSIIVDGSVIQSNSLLNKLNIKRGMFDSWLENELGKRFNYSCVQSMREFRDIQYALTQQGQIRSGHSRHEKDDRRNINDRRNWVLGFDNKEKLRLYEAQAQKLADEIASLDKKINAIERDNQSKIKKIIAAQDIVNHSWTEIDVVSSLDRLSHLQTELQKLRGQNQMLTEIGAQIDKLKSQVKNRQTDVNSKNVLLLRIIEDIQAIENELEQHQEAVVSINIPELIYREIDERASAYKITLKNSSDVSRSIDKEIAKEKEALNESKSNLQTQIEKTFQKFKIKWPQDATDLDTSIEASTEFAAMLERLEKDGLPEYEERFFSMLRNQSMENLAALNTYLSQARKDIIHRMELVNESLSLAEFNPGTYLEIEVTDRNLEIVRAFRQQIREVLSDAWNDDREENEKRFETLRYLIKELSGTELHQQKWRQQVLDVRLHVEFIAREYNSEGQEVEVHRSGAGKSGGQREKLATTCLAAALCYQLGGQDEGIPMYAPVVLDEAFSKADSEFTTSAMRIFENFGFQMIIATPLKSIMTLEPFVGGAAFISIKDRKYSSILQLKYDTHNNCLITPEDKHDSNYA